MTNNAGIALNPWTLRQLRYLRRSTQQEIATAIGCSVSHYRALEAGRVRASLQLVKALEDLHEQQPGVLEAASSGPGGSWAPR